MTQGVGKIPLKETIGDGVSCCSSISTSLPMESARPINKTAKGLPESRAVDDKIHFAPLSETIFVTHSLRFLGIFVGESNLWVSEFSAARSG